MDQHAIDRAVAAATGESVREVQRRGFGLANELDSDFDPEPSPWLSGADDDRWSQHNLLRK